MDIIVCHSGSESSSASSMQCCINGHCCRRSADPSWPCLMSNVCEGSSGRPKNAKTLRRSRLYRTILRFFEWSLDSALGCDSVELGASFTVEAWVIASIRDGSGSSAIVEARVIASIKDGTGVALKFIVPGARSIRGRSLTVSNFQLW